MPESLERTRLARIALAAWVGVTPEQLPQEKMWIEHPNHDSRKAWDRVIEALRAEQELRVRLLESVIRGLLYRTTEDEIICSYHEDTDLREFLPAPERALLEEVMG